MNTVPSSTAESVTSISEASIRTHLASVNRKLAAQNLQEIPINTADWIVENELARMHADSISSYISELSDSVEGENRQRELKRKKAQEELDSMIEKIKKLNKEYDEGGYQENHVAMNAILQELRARGEKSPKRPWLVTRLTPLELMDKKGNGLEKSIINCDAELSHIKTRLQEKILQEIPDTFIQEIEKMLGSIRIKQMQVIHIDEPENSREVKKRKSKNIGIRIAAVIGVIVAGVTFMKPTSTQNSPNGQKNIPIKIDTSKLEGPKDDSKRLADINKVIAEAKFPTELPDTVLTDEALKADLLKLFTKNLKDEMPEYIYNERIITGIQIKKQRFDWENMITEIDIIISTTLYGQIRTTRKAKLVNEKDWKWKG